MASLFLPLLFSFQLVVAINAIQDSALYRTAHFSVGYFKQNPFSYLSVQNLASSMAADWIYCTISCLRQAKCYSFNMAASPDSKGLYRCELLATDKYRSKTKFYADGTFHHYSPESPCDGDPCVKGGDCVPDYNLNTFHCADYEQGFNRTVNCELEENATCSTIKHCNPGAASALYDIDPDMKGGLAPFTVFCDMTHNSGVGVTVVSHDSEVRKRVFGYSGQGTYQRDVVYFGAGVPQLVSLTAVSAHCEQFIKFECRHSRLLYNGDMWGWWVSRDGNKMTYWGGVNSVPYKCACGLNGSCADTSYGCNCDKNDYDWREDSGLLTIKTHLPVVQLRFGDNSGEGEDSYYTLGKLKCNGMV